MRCCTCKDDKDPSCFYNRHNGPNGKDWQCKDCHRKTSKDIDRRPMRRYKAGKSQAKRRGILWTISFEEFIEQIAKPCHYCNNELGKKAETSSGLDRLDNAKGYEPNNVVSCCKVCNQIKMNCLTEEETKIAVEAIISYRHQAEL